MIREHFKGIHLYENEICTYIFVHVRMCELVSVLYVPCTIATYSRKDFMVFEEPQMNIPSHKKLELTQKIYSVATYVLSEGVMKL